MLAVRVWGIANPKIFYFSPPRSLPLSSGVVLDMLWFFEKQTASLSLDSGVSALDRPAAKTIGEAIIIFGGGHVTSLRLNHGTTLSSILEVKLSHP